MVKDKRAQEDELARMLEDRGRFGEKTEIQRQHQAAAQKWRETHDSQIRVATKISTLEDIQRDLKIKLKGEKYGDIEKQYRQKQIHADTTEMAVDVSGSRR
jgi:hypothetical protein